MAGQLEGRRALVTGASGGIGRALALALARAGTDVTLSYSGHRAEADTAAAAVASQGRSATVLQADLSRPGAGRELAVQAGPVTCWWPAPAPARSGHGPG